MTSEPIPSVRSVRRWLRRSRRAHSDRTLGELLSDVYMFALLGALYGGSAVVSIRRHLAQPLGLPAGQGSRAWLILALLIVAVVLAWRGLRALGPLITTPAAQAWCVATPVDRADWLRVPLRWLMATMAIAGVGIAVLAAWAGLAHGGAGQAGTAGTAYGWAAVAGAALGTLIGARAVVAQAGPESRLDGARSRAVVLVGSVILVAGVLVAEPFGVVLPRPWVPAPLIAVAGLAGAVWSVGPARRALSSVDRTTLAGGAQIAGAVMAAAIMLDPAFLSELLAARRWRGVGKVRSRPWSPGRRGWVLLQADLRRQWRRHADLFAWAALALSPFAVAAFAPAAVASARIVAAYVAVDRLAGGLRAVSRTPALRRSLGGSDRALRLIHLAVPAAGLAAWWMATVPAGGVHEPVVTMVLLLGILAAVYRTATRQPISYDAGLAATPLGPIPINLLRRVFRGPDVVAVLVLVGLLVPVAA